MSRTKHHRDRRRTPDLAPDETYRGRADKLRRLSLVDEVSDGIREHVAPCGLVYYTRWAATRIAREAVTRHHRGRRRDAYVRKIERAKRILSRLPGPKLGPDGQPLPPSRYTTTLEHVRSIFTIGWGV